MNSLAHVVRQSGASARLYTEKTECYTQPPLRAHLPATWSAHLRLKGSSTGSTLVNAPRPCVALGHSRSWHFAGTK